MCRAGADAMGKEQEARRKVPGPWKRQAGSARQFCVGGVVCWQRSYAKHEEQGYIQPRSIARYVYMYMYIYVCMDVCFCVCMYVCICCMSWSGCVSMYSNTYDIYYRTSIYSKLLRHDGLGRRIAVLYSDLYMSIY